jgi:hypothetical protein
MMQVNSIQGFSANNPVRSNNLSFKAVFYVPDSPSGKRCSNATDEFRKTYINVLEPKRSISGTLYKVPDHLANIFREILDNHEVAHYLAKSHLFR